MAQQLSPVLEARFYERLEELGVDHDEVDLTGNLVEPVRGGVVLDGAYSPLELQLIAQALLELDVENVAQAPSNQIEYDESPQDPETPTEQDTYVLPELEEDLNNMIF